MKRLLTFIFLATFAFSINAQRYMSVTKKDGSVTEFAVSAIDSIHFFVKDNTTPEPPVVNPDDPFENGHEYVDLGLPSGTLWATMNVGAESVTDYGDYFAWGETSAKEDADYTLQNYKWYTSDTIVEVDADGFEKVTYINQYTKYNTDEKYGIVDNITTLELVDDAAHVNWGGAWRMPTQKELQELLDNCTWEWGTRNGVTGYKVSSKETGNNNNIFIPAAGSRPDLHWEASIFYWSSSLSEYGSNGAWGFFEGLYLKDANRGLGFSIRPVCSSAQK